MTPTPRDTVARKRISPLNFLGTYLLLALAAGGLVVGGHFTGHLAYGALGGLVVVALGFLYIYLVRVSTEYLFYTDSIEVVSGIVARNIENVQLFRVRDIRMKQSILGRILNVGSIEVDSTDESAPCLILHGVDDPRRLYEILRELVSQSQAARRTTILESEPTNIPHNL